MTTAKKQPKKTVAARPASSAQEWKKTSKSKASPLAVPSGNVCLVRRPGLAAFLSQGIIPNSLLGILQEAAKGKGIDDETMQRSLGELAQDPKRLQEMMELTDSVAVHCVVQPKLRWARWTQEDADEGLCESKQVGKRIDEDDRDDAVLYVDEVDEEDKMFIFNWAVGGDRDVDRFRAEQAELVESLSAGQDVGDHAEPSPGPGAG